MCFSEDTENSIVLQRFSMMLSFFALKIFFGCIFQLYPIFEFQLPPISFQISRSVYSNNWLFLCAKTANAGAFQWCTHIGCRVKQEYIAFESNTRLSFSKTIFGTFFTRYRCQVLSRQTSWAVEPPSSAVALQHEPDIQIFRDGDSKGEEK